MSNIINKIMSNIPESWNAIKKEDYPLKRVYVSDSYQIIEAFDASGELVVINHYPEYEGFIEAYHEQFEEIKKIVKGKDWKDISVLNPLKNTYLKNEKNEKIYICVFETYNTEEKVSVQLFYEDENFTIGISTFVRIEKNVNILNTVKKDAIVNQILNFFVK